MSTGQIRNGLAMLLMIAWFAPGCTAAPAKPSISGATWAERFIHDMDSAKDREVRARMEEDIKEISFQEQGLEKVINFLSDTTELQYFVNWTALQAAGIDRKTPVTVHLHDVSHRKALTTVLREVGGGAANLDYAVDEGVITVSTRDDLFNKNISTQLYDIRELLARAHGAEQRARRYMEIVNSIYSAVSSSSWQNSGGTVGTLAQFDDYLVITQSRDNHVAIARLLGRLRDMGAPN